MKGLHILIVDDEQPARKKIRSYLTQEKSVDLVSEASNGIEAVRNIQKNKPDLVFLDIQMPGMNGFEVIQAVGVENMPAVVFVTAYDQYAIDAFEVQAVDYLLKPYDQARFRKSFRRGLKWIDSENENTMMVKRLLEEIKKEKKHLKTIMVNVGPRYFFVQTREIIYISAEEKYVNLHTEKETYLIRETMSNMEKRLDPSTFTRIHRSTIINTDFIQEIQPWSHGDYIVILKNGTKLILSRRFRDRLFCRT